MNRSILEIQGINVNPDLVKPIAPQQQDVECVDTKIYLWDGDSYDEFESDYLNQIYPYKINKKTIPDKSQFIFHFLSSSLYYWVQFIQGSQPKQGEFGKKDIKTINQILQKDQCDNWIAYRRWGQYFMKKSQYEKHQKIQQNFVQPKGQVIHSYKRGEDQFVIVKYTGDNKQFSLYKQRMQVLFLFYIDGVSFVHQQIDTWIYYLIFKKIQGKNKKNFVGALSEYDFRLTINKQRHRISQVFILPIYQKYGHGKQILDIVYTKSLKDPKCFQITTQIPSFQYQCLRDYKQLELIILNNFFNEQRLRPIKNGEDIIELRQKIILKQQFRKIKQILKIPGHQIQRLINILIYYQILNQNDDMPKAYFQEDLKGIIVKNRSPFKTRKKLPHLTLYGKVPNLKDFFLQRAKQNILRNQQQVIQILQQSIKGFSRVINKLKKQKLLK